MFRTRNQKANKKATREGRNKAESYTKMILQERFQLTKRKLAANCKDACKMVGSKKASRLQEDKELSKEVILLANCMGATKEVSIKHIAKMRATYKSRKPCSKEIARMFGTKKTINWVSNQAL